MFLKSEVDYLVERVGDLDSFDGRDDQREQHFGGLKALRAAEVRYILQYKRALLEMHPVLHILYLLAELLKYLRRNQVAREVLVQIHREQPYLR